MKYSILCFEGLVLLNMKNYKESQVWKDSMDLYKMTCPIVQSIRKEFYFKLSEQMESSCGSISDNIAEGFGRYGNKELVQFLCIANGSCCEFSNQLQRAFYLGCIPEIEFEKLNTKSQEVQKQLNLFIAYLRRNDFKGFKYK